MTNRKTIYGPSYDQEPTEKVNEGVEMIAKKRRDENQERKLGLMLREERNRTQELQRRIRTLEDENRRLKEALKQRD